MGQTLFNIITIIIAGFGLVLSIISFVYNYKISKRRNTIDAYVNLQKDLYVLYEYATDEIETFVTDCRSDEYKMLSSCVAQIEIFATGVNTGVYDFEVLYSMAHGYLDGALRSRIEHILELKNGKEYYQNTIKLLEKMDSHI